MVLLTEISGAATEALKAWREVCEFYQTVEGPDGAQFDLTGNIPSVSYSLHTMDVKIQACGNLLKSLENVVVPDGAPLPVTFLETLETSSNELSGAIISAYAVAENVEGRTITSVNPGNWNIQVEKPNQTINFASLLQGLAGKIEACLISYYRVAPIVGSSKFDVFADALDEFSTTASDVRAIAKAIRTIGTKSENAFSTIEISAAESTKAVASIKDALVVVSKIQTDVTSSLSAIEESRSNVGKIVEESEGLKLQVDAYRNAFEAFQKTLDQETEKMSAHDANAYKLFQAFDEKNKFVANLISQSEEMLKGATNAGLASTFKNTLDILDKKLWWAQGAFYVSITILFASALPLAYYLFSIGSMAGIDVAELSTDTSGILDLLSATLRGTQFSPLSTIALASLMAPAIWLAKFAASRHHQLFQLREHYQFKYSLAMAVDGFKKQAPSYEEAIAAETFNRLLFNPADKISGGGKADALPNPILDRILEKIGINAKGGND